MALTVAITNLGKTYIQSQNPNVSSLTSNTNM